MKVNISGTISKDRRPDSGLDEIGEKMHANRLQRVAVVGIIEYHAYHDVAGKAETLAVRFAAIEPLIGEDDLAARTLLDKARKARGVGSTELTLFDVNPEDSNGPWPGDKDFKASGATGEQGTLSDAAYELSKVRPAAEFKAPQDAETVTEALEGKKAPADTPKPKRARRGALAAVESQ